MGRTFSNGKYIYSVDMMFSYINNFKPRVWIIPIPTFNLYDKVWGDYSPYDVITNPSKHTKELERVRLTDLMQPIIVHGDEIVDGWHRLLKALSQQKRFMLCYDFDQDLMSKFIIGYIEEQEKVDKMEHWEFIDLFIKRFS